MEIKGISRFSFPTNVVFGPGAIKELPGVFKELKIEKPFIVTDPGFSKTDSFKSILAVLDSKNILYSIYSDVNPNPHDTDVEKGTAEYRKDGCDGIIAVGGGSPMDTAKAIAVLAGQGGLVADYDAQRSDCRPIVGPLPPLVTVPTTSGTGSEVGKCSVITSTSLGRKIFMCSPHMLAKQAVLDPELVVTLPPHLTAFTGMDAITHNIESLTAPIFHPMCDAIAVKGIELGVAYLEKAVKSPSDIQARGYMMMCAMMGAVAFQKDLGTAHSMSHALSAVCGLQHGLANAISLPVVMNYNKEISRKEYALVARAFGINIFGMDELEAAEKAIEEVAALNKRIGIPASLKETGVKEEQLREVSDKAFLDPCHLTNSRGCTKEDLYDLLKQAYEGTL